MQSAIAARACDEWVELMTAAGIPAAPINSFADVLEHPHTRASGIVREFEHGRYGTLKTIAQPILFDGRRNEPVSPPPRHGEHTESVLTELGYCAADIRRLEEANVVMAAADGDWGTMVALRGADIVRVPISEFAGKTRTVPRSLYDEVSVFFG